MIYIVPFVEDDEKYFLKTIYPSRKAYEKYKEKNNLEKVKFLDKEEEQIINSFEKDEWISDLTKESKIEIEEAASFSMKKNKRINLRLTEKDYHDIKIKAVQKGIPYQSLISSLIHQYNKGGIFLTL